MKSNITERVFILDRSGSVRGLESDTIGGWTALLDALGGTTCHVAEIHKYARPEDMPENTTKAAYPKLLISRTRHAETQHEGIRVIDVADWLLAPW